MKKGAGLIAAVAVVAVLMVGGVGVAAWQPWAGGGIPEAVAPAESGERGGVVPDGRDAGALPEGVEVLRTKPESEYVKPDGTNVIRRGDYDSDEAYSDAVEKAGEAEARVPHEWEEVSAGGVSARYVKGVLTVQFLREAGEAEARSLIEGEGGVWVSSTFAWDTGLKTAQTEAYFPDAGSLDDLERIAHRLEQHVDAVQSATVDTGGEWFLDDGAEVDDPHVGEQYALGLCRFVEAWGLARCDGSVEVAVMDSGVYSAHEDFSDADGRPVVAGAYDVGRTDPDDAVEATGGHGTAVAGIACAATGNAVGIAGASHGARIVSVCVSTAGNLVDMAAVGRGLERIFTMQNKPEAINMSFGTNFDFDPFWLREGHLQDLVDQARGYGIVCVAAVGNDGDSTSYLPARLDGVVGVGAVDEDSEVIAQSNRNSTVDIVAPGMGVYTTQHPYFGDGALYGYHGRTSMAAPFVSAAAALLKAQHPGWSAGDVEARLESTARKVPAMGGADRTDAYGHGVLDAYAALGGGASPSTGPSDGEATEAQVERQLQLQSTGPEDVPAALEGAMAANPDVWGWLLVPGTFVSVPLAARASDDARYLSHDASGERSPVGCAFCEGGPPDLSAPVTAVYGHSFAAGPLAFTTLHAFEDASFFASHGEAYVYLPGRRLKYRVVGAYLYTDRGIGLLDQSDPDALGAYFSDLSDPDPSTFVGFKRRGVTLDPGSDRLLQLSTCTAPVADPAHRFVVTCVYVGEEEL